MGSVRAELRRFADRCASARSQVSTTIGRAGRDYLGLPTFELPGASMPLVVNTSIGIAVGDRGSGSELLRDADVALYQAKAGGKNRYEFFRAEMQTDIGRRIALEFDLRSSLSESPSARVFKPRSLPSWTKVLTSAFDSGDVEMAMVNAISSSLLSNRHDSASILHGLLRPSVFSKRRNGPAEAASSPSGAPAPMIGGQRWRVLHRKRPRCAPAQYPIKWPSRGPIAKVLTFVADALESAVSSPRTPAANDPVEAPAPAASDKPAPSATEMEEAPASAVDPRGRMTARTLKIPAEAWLWRSAAARAERALPDDERCAYA